MENKSAVEITSLTDKKIVVQEIECRNGRTYMRARIRNLRRR